ncbi:MAG: MBL fold metallo-hydrolase [Flavobacteriales bacterium]|jgi:hydroxyacylglutathione hydrolase|nr:MBL fold metallo-hydrolase [Flavobacteriales bacterium]
MRVEQIYTSCLAQGAYYIESNGQAAVIDPLREVGAYIEMAEERGAKIKYVFETHFHADFVSGHLSLAKQTGAKIVFGPTAKTNFEAIIAEDNQVFEIGYLSIKVLHTPGHTMESSCYLLSDETGKDKAIFSGDTLFLGDVGRPDLAQKSDITKQDLAGILFDSLRTKIIPLTDDVIVYPGHGAGSACGKNMSKETVGTIGHEKATNYALRADMTKQEFIKEVINGILPPPAYFSENVKLNIQGTSSVDVVIEKAIKPISVADFKELSTKKNSIVLDVRNQKEFVKGFIPDSIFIGIDGGFAPWVGAIIKAVDTSILLVCDKDRLQETATRLSRVGFDNILGHLQGGINAWDVNDLHSLQSISAKKFASIYKEDNAIHIVDVRKASEYNSQHISGAELAPLSNLDKHHNKFTTSNENFVHCAGGYRSVIAGSLLKKQGISNVINIEGGFDAIKETVIPLSDFICPTTL